MVDTEGGQQSTEGQTNVKATGSTDDTLQTQNDQDPNEVARLAEREADRERIRQEEREALKREFETQRDEERRSGEEQYRQAQLLESFGSTVREVRENLKKLQFWDDNGSRRSLTDGEIEELVVTPVARYNLNGRRAEALRLQAEMAQEALKTIPEAKRESFIKNASNKQLSEWFDHYVETRAETSPWAKQLVKDHEAAVTAAEARGYTKAKGSAASPPGTTTTGTGGSSAPNEHDLNTLTGLLKARRAGTVPDDVFYPKFREFNKS